MDPQITHIYEQIDNQILRLLFYFGAIVITSLSSAMVYLWATWRQEQRERIEIDKATAAAMTAVANQLDNLRDALDEFRRALSK